MNEPSDNAIPGGPRGAADWVTLSRPEPLTMTIGLTNPAGGGRDRS